MFFLLSSSNTVTCVSFVFWTMECQVWVFVVVNDLKDQSPGDSKNGYLEDPLRFKFRVLNPTLHCRRISN